MAPLGGPRCLGWIRPQRFPLEPGTGWQSLSVPELCPRSHPWGCLMGLWGSL